MRQQTQLSDDVVFSENSNLEIPVLGHRQYRDFEIEKSPGIRDFGIAISNCNRSTIEIILICGRVCMLPWSLCSIWI